MNKFARFNVENTLISKFHCPGTKVKFEENNGYFSILLQHKQLENNY